MKIAFFGTGEFSKNILAGLYAMSDISIELVVSQPDKPQGRKKVLTPTQVHTFSSENGLDIMQPEKLKTSPLTTLLIGEGDNKVDFYKKLKSLNLDFIVVVAYGKIIPQEILDIPKYGCINLHGSILPDYRGASPIQEAIKNGDKVTGLTSMYMSAGMDEGDILEVKKINIREDETTNDIFQKFQTFGPILLYSTLTGIIKGDLKGTPQDDSKATYCSKISKEDGEVFFQKQSSQEIYNKYRAYKTWPGIYTYFKGKKLNLEEVEKLPHPSPLLLGEGVATSEKLIPGQVIKLDKKNIGIVCADKEILLLKQVKLEGKKSMDIMSFCNGNSDFVGSEI